MKKLNLKDVSLYVEQNITAFHYKRIQSLDGLKLSQVLKRKNPYLFKTNSSFFIEHPPINIELKMAISKPFARLQYKRTFGRFI